MSATLRTRRDWATERRVPRPVPVVPPAAVPPDGVGYRLKCRLLGSPLHTEQLEHERLGKPTALAVFASDNLSSSAYATEEILRVLVPAVGVAAFALVVPITIAMLVVLALLILSYRETIKAYPTAGGAYSVTRDNFGLLPAQVAGVALLTDYVLTVAVSVAAGSAALVSAVPALTPYTVPLSIGFIAIVGYGNLRGVRESGRVFAVPTYFFVANMALLVCVGLVRFVTGTLPTAPADVAGLMDRGSAGSGVLMGASLFVVLHAFASGGAAVTGVEAISNGVPAFRKPEWRNARTTLVVMGTLLGGMFFGLSALASRMHVTPFEHGTPTVVAQVGRLVYGPSGPGRLAFYALQAGTMLILVLAANTSFADFPRLASFQAGDNFLPRQLTKRGHRLVFSNGIVFLALTAMVLVVLTRAKVDRLIPLYAIGVFTSFTLSQAGMARHHLRLREPGWQRGLVVNGLGAGLSAVVDVVIGITKFADGAWLVIVLVPMLVVFLFRLNRQYETEAEQLEHGVPEATTAPLLRRHVVLVFIDRLDLAAARAIQYARTLNASQMRAVHFVVDPVHGENLAAEWTRLGLSRIPLELVDCPDRRLTRCAVETVARDLADGQTEVSVLLPDRKYPGLWRRILHDRTAEAIERDLSRLAHANVTTVPFLFASRSATAPAAPDVDLSTIAPPAPAPSGVSPNGRAAGVQQIADVHFRGPTTVEGRIQSMRVQPLGDVPTLECVVGDGTAAVSVVFLGRRSIAGVCVGARIRVEGRAAERDGRLAIWNPVYQLLP